MIRRCEMIVPLVIAWGEIERRCPNESMWRVAEQHYFCDGCFREGLRDGTMTRLPFARVSDEEDAAE